MRKLIIQEWISIDGFAADRNGRIDFFNNPKFNLGWEVDELVFMDSIDTIILGATTYKMFAAYWPEADTAKELVADKLNSTTKIVFSQTLDKAPWGNWEPAQIKADPIQTITAMKMQEGKDIVLWGSLTIARSLISANLVDEYQLAVTPAFLGSGLSFIPENYIMTADLVKVKSYESGIVKLTYVAASPDDE
ncbi:dihydrofolate reductase family protein [Daejeonella lutea]|uniref:Dihydrofolate reductase n=1 Tax=Daejeonella lutea TaxID=572036 RepID=A0A1T5DX77_9SPHI|nr:dihydrofolate reductase family protein [Daejeonella lutea]SKB76083.1 Dihydrofolate reductase [Daejeonella lutea]